MKHIQIAFGIIIAATVVIGLAYYMSGTQTPLQPPVSHGGPVKDYVSLIDALRAKGLVVEPAGKLIQPFFTVEAQIITVDGKQVQVFEYSNEASMNTEVSKVSPDGGTIGNSKVTWIEPPHFYKTGRIIVLYVGSNSTIIGALNDVIDPQFAGGKDTVSNDRIEEIAKNFIIDAPTFKFDGMPESLNITSIIVLESYPPQYVVTITFDSRHAGYGDRVGQALAQVITKHTAVVRIVQGKVTSAVLDNQWDEINQRPLP
ncbi:MAG: hypothetical protein HYY67_06950 [Thaumarchaeota archaeon]|nr:hypothetical protein [Nitrososphaerota archaeon]